jgi:hypothetical protein
MAWHSGKVIRQRKKENPEIMCVRPAPISPATCLPSAKTMELQSRRTTELTAELQSCICGRRATGGLDRLAGDRDGEGDNKMANEKPSNALA